MKKLIAIILILTLACAALPVLAEEWIDFHCTEMQFTTKVPAGAAVRYEEGSGLRIYTKTEGSIPYVQVTRRPSDKKFSDPANVLNNIYRERLEDKYGSVGMSTAKKWEIGGRELLGAKYLYKLSGIEVTEIVLIDIRDAGDVEIYAKFYEGNEDVTMAALNEAVRNYLEDGTAAAQGRKQEEPAPKASDGEILKPEIDMNTEVDLQNGVYFVHVTDTEHIFDGGCFTIELYEKQRYAAAGVEALKAGDQVEIFHRTWTVDALEPQEDGELRIIPKEEFTGYMAFRKNEDGSYNSRIGDWYPVTFLTDTQVMMPLPNDFTFVWVDADNSSQVYDADGFIRLLTDGTFTNKDLSPYNTAITIRDGLVYGIAHSEYPIGPDEY